MEWFDKKQTEWEGLWYDPKCGCFISPAFNMATLKQFKGFVRLWVTKNRYFEKGTKKPNYVFCIKDTKSYTGKELTVKDKPDEKFYEYEDEDGNRLYTYDEVCAVLRGAIRDVENGYTDLCVDDYV